MHTRPRLMWSINLISASALLLHLSACADMGFPKTWELGGLRVLALQADQPEVNPTVDGEFTISPIISDIEGEGRALQYEIQFCYDPSVSFGANPNCENHLESLLGSAVTRSGTLGLPLANATGVATPAIPGDFTFTVPVEILALFDPVENASELNNGVPYSVVFTLSDPSTGESVTSFRRISVTTRTVLNQNPVISGLEDANGDAFSSVSAGEDEVQLKAVATDASTETYTAIYRDGSSVEQTETLSFSWFTNSGEFSGGRSEVGGFVTYTPPTTESVAAGEADSPFMWVLVRDDRGGVSAVLVPTTTVQ